jgi:hypothetical protein
MSRGLGAVAFVALFWGCRSDRVPEPERVGAAGPKSEAFSFVLPADYVPLELRGEGSELIHVPPGTRLTRGSEGFSLDAGPDFSVLIRATTPALEQLKASLAGSAKLVFEGEDLLILEREGGYAFVVVRQLVPEWDESDRRTLSCSSAGFEAGSGILPRSFTRAATDRMVAACRSLDLPSLE